jgi:HK97 family phage major capsid protein
MARSLLLPLVAVFALFALAALTTAQAGETAPLVPVLGLVVTAGLSPKQLLETRGNLLAEARKILDAAYADGQRDLTPEENDKYEEMIKDADECKRVLDEKHAAALAHKKRLDQIEAAEQESRSYGDFSGFGGGSAAPPNPSGAGGQPTPEDHNLAVQGWFINQSSRSDVPLRQEHRDAADRVGLRLDARELVVNLDPDFHRVQHQYQNALQTTSGTAGGYLRPQGFQNSLETAMLHFGGMLNVAEVIRTTNANPFAWPTANDTTNTGRQIGEAKAISNVDPSFAQVEFYAYKFISDGVLISFELLRDTPFRLESVIGAMLGERLGRVLNTKCTTGTGAATPTGIVTSSVEGKETASATAITADELLDLQYSVDRAYRDMPGVGWMMHDQTAKAVRKLTADERYHWVDGMDAGEPSSLFGKPVQVNNDMAQTLEAGAKSVLYGDFRKYKIRQVNTVRIYRLTERHRENDQDEFLAFTEFDGKLIDAGGNPVKHLLQKAT